MIYEKLIIQPKIWGKLTDYFTKNKLPNAILIHGNEGIGKEAHAIEFASFINCDNKIKLESCGTCNSCMKMKFPGPSAMSSQPWIFLEISLALQRKSEN